MVEFVLNHNRNSFCFAFNRKQKGCIIYHEYEKKKKMGEKEVIHSNVIRFACCLFMDRCFFKTFKFSVSTIKTGHVGNIELKC